MKKLITMIAVSLFLIACSKEKDETTTLKVTVESNYNGSVLSLSGANVYVFKAVNQNDYNYIGDGKLKNKTTGAEVLFFEKRTSSIGSIIFENYKNQLYTVVAEITTLDKQHNDWRMTSIDLPENVPAPYENNKIKFVFDIWPYKPGDF